ncbi:MAG: UvrD-helicase domain-containing protein [Actinomycetota bacterium]
MSVEQLSLTFHAQPELPDQQARDCAQHHIDTSFVVSAGAGAGKTETLIRRLEQALHAGCDPAGLVAITFTDRAARDLVNKLRVKLPAEHLPAIERMSVGTIHSFCLSILRRHPLEAGLPPVFATQDELLSGTDSVERAHRIRNAFFDAIAERDDTTLRQALDVLVAVNGMFHFDALIGLIDQQWDRFDEVTFITPPEWQAPCHTALHSITALANDTTVPDKLREKLGEMQPSIDAFLACDSMAAARDCIPSTRALGNNGGTAAKPVRDRVKQLVDSLLTTVDDCAVRHVLQVLVPLVVREAHARYQSGSLSFDDILVLTRRLLDRRPGLCAHLRGEISHLCVDEFQDTDVVQYDIVHALTAPRDDAPAPVLFAVGDPKQSIYGFREADVGLFERLRALPHVTPLQLSTNFRSRPGVLHWLNSVFERWFEADAAAGQVAFSPLLDHVPDAPATVMVVGGELDGPADLAAQAQAHDIARVVATARGTWICRHDAGERPAAYTDIAVLVRTRADLTHLEPALRRAGIPYVIEGGALLYDTRETRDLLRVLTAVNDTASPITAVAALRTSVLAISDIELLEHRRAGGSWSPFGDADRPGHPAVLSALAQLRRWSDARHRVPVPDLLAEIASDTWSHAASLIDGAPTTTWRRLRLVLDEARWWFEQTGGSLGEYLRWVAMRVENDDRSNVTTDETDEDAVHVLTVHAAKGLEFPVVIAAGLGRQRPTGDSVRASFHTTAEGERVVAMKVGRIATLDFTSGHERNLAMLEAARLAYVACTRARDHLVICLHHGKRARPNSAAELIPHLQPDFADAAIDFPPLAVVDRPPMSELSDRTDRPADRAVTWRVRSSWSATQLRHGDDDASPAVESTAGVADVAADVAAGDTGSAVESIHSKPPRPYAALPDQIGRYGTRVGRAVHGVVQTIALHHPRRALAELVQQHCIAEEVPERLHSYVLRLVESIIASDVFARMAAASTVSTVRREMYVGGWVADGGTPDGEGIYGIIDAVWLEAGRFVVVDFKTDHVLETADTLADRYRTQLHAYARALRAATGREVAETLLCVALPDGSPAVTIAVPSTA